MRKIISIVFFFLIIISLSGCGENTNKITNNAPITLNHNLMVYENSTISFDLSNITSDAENDSLIYAISDVTKNGLLVLDKTLITYTPIPNFHGIDQFTFYVSDRENTVRGHITITVLPSND